MVGWLIRKYVPDWQNHSSMKVRSGVGRVCQALGICLNLFLFLSKYIIGVLVNSVAIKGDAVNNLTDAASNIAAIVSFHLAEKPADKEHPYGHERIETITALFMGIVIGYLGIEMLRQSIAKIIHPSPVDFEWYAVLVLILSMCVKAIMADYNRKYGKIYDSPVLLANALDSRNDMIGTAMVLFSTLVSPLIHYDLDGIVGVIVSFVILWSAYGLIRDVVNKLVGEAPSRSLLNQIIDLILEDEMILDVHDVVIHTYGPEMVYGTAHAEVDSRLGLMEVHDSVDALEKAIRDEMNINMVIHVDPVVLHDSRHNELEDLFSRIIVELDDQWSTHDFRTHLDKDGPTVVSFDLVVPYSEKRSAKEISDLILEKTGHPEDFCLEIELEHPYS